MITFATADDVLPIRCKRHCLYIVATVDFDERGTLLSRVSMNAASIHQNAPDIAFISDTVAEQSQKSTSCLLRTPLYFIDINQFAFHHLVFSALVHAGPRFHRGIVPLPTWHRVTKACTDLRG